jgi:hypothetical protein
MERKTAGSGFGARLVSSERYGEDGAGYCRRGRRVASSGHWGRPRACGVYEIKGGDEHAMPDVEGAIPTSGLGVSVRRAIG